MNQHDTTQMIAAHIAAELALTEPNRLPAVDEDFEQDDAGGWWKHKDGYWLMCGFAASPTRKCGHSHYRMLVLPMEDRVARYAARLAVKTCDAVQAELNKS